MQIVMPLLGNIGFGGEVFQAHIINRESCVSCTIWFSWSFANPVILLDIIIKVIIQVTFHLQELQNLITLSLSSLFSHVYEKKQFIHFEKWFSSLFVITFFSIPLLVRDSGSVLYISWVCMWIHWFIYRFEVCWK